MFNEWEDLCRKCGKCCYHKLVLLDGTVIFDSTHCEYLDIDTKLCTSYENRHEVCSTCSPVTMETIPKIQHCLAPDCPYLSYYDKNK